MPWIEMIEDWGNFGRRISRGCRVVYFFSIILGSKYYGINFYNNIFYVNML